MDFYTNNLEKSDQNCFVFLKKYIVFNFVGSVSIEIVYFLFEKQALKGLLKVICIQKLISMNPTQALTLKMAIFKNFK